MLEGAVNFALTPVLTGEITVQDGAVKQNNFHDYKALRIDEAPCQSVIGRALYVRTHTGHPLRQFSIDNPSHSR